ncbi:hypothetical protein ACVDG5_025530 [Mesorhizobium sp. ORM6]
MRDVDREAGGQRQDRGSEAEQDCEISTAMSGEFADRVDKTPVIPHPTASACLGLVAADRAMQDSSRTASVMRQNEASDLNSLFLFDFSLCEGE